MEEIDETSLENKVTSVSKKSKATTGAHMHQFMRIMAAKSGQCPPRNW